MNDAAIKDSYPNIDLIKLDIPLEGFYNFIGCWIYYAGDQIILVDPGPRSTMATLVNVLRERGIKKIDYILLTHIHIDHAGGAGLLLQHYPEAQVICHPEGIPYMVAPAKLWASSLKMLGPIAAAYGEIEPIPAGNISYAKKITLCGTTINVLETPGHAIHHLSYQIDDILFAGEVAGTYYPLEKGLYLRPATPATFYGDAYRQSLEKVASLDISLFCFGHYGRSKDVKHVLDVAQNQFAVWIETVDKHRQQRTLPLEEKVFTELLEKDQGLPYFNDLPVDVQKREKNFAFNSIHGMMNYLDSKGS